jgi:2-polyprenyl-3-methyl-5-hydroxy-6-metoxy-1,4-benzoquinol methylase
MYLAKSRGWARVLGCDLNEHHAQVAKQYYNVEVITAEFESLTDLDCNWTCVLLHHGIEHCRYPRIVLNNVSEMLVPGGLIYLAHPHSVCAEDMESGGHVHEWSYDSFANMLYWYPQFKVLNSGYSGRAQFWFLRKD